MVRPWPCAMYGFKSNIFPDPFRVVTGATQGLRCYVKRSSLTSRVNWWKITLPSLHKKGHWDEFSFFLNSTLSDLLSSTKGWLVGRGEKGCGPLVDNWQLAWIPGWSDNLLAHQHSRCCQFLTITNYLVNLISDYDFVFTQLHNPHETTNNFPGGQIFTWCRLQFLKLAHAWILDLIILDLL